MKEEKISTNSELAEGLKMALTKGESLARAKMTLLNAGYKEENIEAAANLLGVKKIEQSKPGEQKTTPNPIQAKSPDFQVKFGFPKVTQNVSNYEQPPKEVVQLKEENPSQKVSDYEKPESKSNKKMAIFLAILLIILAGSLILILLFKEQLIDFFGGFF